MANVELIRSRDLAQTVPYAYAAVVDAGRVIFTAGACPLDPAGEIVAPGDVAAQAEQTMENLVLALRAAGAELTDVAKTTVYVASSDRSDLVAAWEVVARVFGSHDVPSTLLGVAVLGYADQLVEIEAAAVRHGGSEALTEDHTVPASRDEAPGALDDRPAEPLATRSAVGGPMEPVLGDR
ncbi:MAG: RidA family protein [Acidimicrobiia bacterium]|nr:RidA family protein [Acidimicrobiia bacterium]